LGVGGRDVGEINADKSLSTKASKSMVGALFFFLFVGALAVDVCGGGSVARPETVLKMMKAARF